MLVSCQVAGRIPTNRKSGPVHKSLLLVKRYAFRSECRKCKFQFLLIFIIKSSTKQAQTKLKYTPKKCILYETFPSFISLRYNNYYFTGDTTIGLHQRSGETISQLRLYNFYGNKANSKSCLFATFTRKPRTKANRSNTRRSQSGRENVSFTCTPDH